MGGPERWWAVEGEGGDERHGARVCLGLLNQSVVGREVVAALVLMHDVGEGLLGVAIGSCSSRNVVGKGGREGGCTGVDA